ncbi:bifunctional DNA primase/polymerase [Devosia sp. SD17-2]|uniref:bifunctional DNA primase/polymerase n=1 Tax=Devosia sp. SD17-2 TaxID=2976459 RepID=UPI0023D8A3FB|nr:bifunctional DNA primase/polymerase [Devosia sp. SD17-2]WEJ31708.1 bifunctional DNA primase/polymerase [Devosia sp. SD17-2]
MKIQSSLKELRQKKPSKPLAGSRWDDPTNRPPDMLKHLRETRLLTPDLVRGWKLTDDEIHQILVVNQRPLVDAVGVEEGEFAYARTALYLGGPTTDRGWSVVPQQRTGDRKPSPIPYSLTDKKTGRTKNYFEPFLPSKWREQRVPLREFVHWHTLWNANLAIQCCAASGHARAIDIDCRTEEVAEHVMQLAFEHLGTTPFVRVGMAPKLLLLYRVEGEDIDIGSFSVTLGNPDGTVDIGDDGQPLNAIEFLGNGKIVTCYGLHHKTGKPFDWTRGTLHPAAAGPENAPVITKDSLAAFFNAVHSYRPFLSRGSSSNPYGGKASFEAFEARDISGERMWMFPVSAHGTDSGLSFKECFGLVV